MDRWPAKKIEAPSTATPPPVPPPTPVPKGGGDTTVTGVIGEKEHKFKEELEKVLKDADEKIAEIKKYIEELEAKKKEVSTPAS
jgi:cytochrome c556